jgi:hypothetical protein
MMKRTMTVADFMSVSETLTAPITGRSRTLQRLLEVALTDHHCARAAMLLQPKTT